MASNSIKINSDVNTVNIQPDNNRITVVNPDGCSVNVTQPITNVIQVATPGITGPIGLTGPSGSVGPSGSFDTSSFVTTSSFNSFTSSIQSEVNSLTSVTSSYVLNSQTGSFATTSSFNSFTSSIQSEVNSLTLQTGSYATTGSNNFVGNQVITGSLTVSGSSTFTNIGPAVFSGTSTFTNITSSGNISASGNIIATEVTASKITGDNTSLTLGYVGDNNIRIEKTGDFFIDGSQGTIEMYGQGADLYIGDSITLQGNVIATSHITASGNISSSGNIIANQIDTTQITGNPSTVTLGYAGTNNITIENGGDLFINAPEGGIEIDGGQVEIRSGDGPIIEVTDVILLRNSDGVEAIQIEPDQTTFFLPVNQLISNTFLSSSNVITTDVTASKITGGNTSLTLGNDGDNYIYLENGGDMFIDASSGGLEIYGGSSEIFLADSGITLNGNIVATSNITASGNISSSGTITGTTGSFNHIIGTIANVIWTIDFTDGELSTRLYAPYNLSIDSVTNITGSPTTSITSSGSPYTLGNAITVGTPIDVTSSISSVINLNITR